MSIYSTCEAVSKEGHAVLDMEPDTLPLFDTHGSPEVRYEPRHRYGAAPVLVTRAGTHVEEYERAYVEPVRKLRATLADVLDVEANPARDPDEALSILKDAMETFNEESDRWL